METVKNLSGKKIKAKRHKRVNRSLGGDITVFVTITLLGMFIALPLVYAIGNAFKPLDELWLFPPPLLPAKSYLEKLYRFICSFAELMGSDFQIFL